MTTWGSNDYAWTWGETWSEVQIRGRSDRPYEGSADSRSLTCKQEGQTYHVESDDGLSLSQITARLDS